MSTSDYLIDTEKIVSATEIAAEANAKLYEKTYLLDQNVPLSIADLDLDSMAYETALVDEPSSDMIDSINQTPLTFSPINKDSVLIEDLIGFVPQNENEVIISSYLADWLINSGKADSYQALIDENVMLDLKGLSELKVVGIVEYETPILNNELTALYTVGNTLYVSETFFD